MRVKVTSIVIAYVLLLVVCFYIYHSYPDRRKEVEFWIPQLFLIVLIIVTTLYVFFTAHLVEETRRLQQRPILKLTFREMSEPPSLRMNALLEYAEDQMRSVARVVGGEEFQPQPKWLAIEFKNIGHSTVRNVSTKVALTIGGGLRTQEQQFDGDIKSEDKIQIALAPASLPWMKVEVQSVLYGDGLRNYVDFVGHSTFERAIGQAG